MSALNVNGREHPVDADPDTPILWALRDTLGMTGTKFGCGAALCGACTVHLDGEAIRSCVTPISAAAGQKDHHDRSGDRRQRPCRCRRACRLGQARRGAVRLLPERPDHERHRVPEVAAARQAADRRRNRRRPWPATSAAAAPMPASAPPWPTPPHARLKEPPCCPISTTANCRARCSACWHAATAPDRRAAAPQLPEAGRRRRPGARRLSRTWPRRSRRPAAPEADAAAVGLRADRHQWRGHGDHQPAGVRPGRADRACR